MQPESVHQPRHAHDQRGTVLGRQHPIEEVRFALAGDAEIGERLAVQQGRGARRRGVDHGAPGDGFGNDRQVGVLQKQGVVAHAGPIGEAQEAVPQLALQPGFRGASDVGPQLAEVGQGTAGGDAVAPELAHDGVRVGRQRFADGNRALQPDQQIPRDLRVGMIAAGFDHGSVLEEIGDEVGAVGRQPDVVVAGRALTVGQIPREFFFRGAAFAAQVGLELQDGAAQQGIDPPVDFGDAPLEVDVPALRPEPIHDEAVEQGADFLVTGARGEFRDHRGAFVLRQHGRRPSPGRQLAGGTRALWIPAFAGMTTKRRRNDEKKESDQSKL